MFVQKLYRRARHKLVRILCAAQQSALCPEHVRRWLLNAMGARIHRTAKISHGVFIGLPRNLRMDRHSALSTGCFLDGHAQIIIEAGVRCGPHVRILTGTHPIEDSVFRRKLLQGLTKLPVHIERGCWIGMGATIMPGVVVAEGCVIGANALVTKSTLANGLYVNMADPVTRTVHARRLRDLPVGRSSRPRADPQSGGFLEIA